MESSQNSSLNTGWVHILSDSKGTPLDHTFKTQFVCMYTSPLQANHRKGIANVYLHNTLVIRGYLSGIPRITA